MQLRATPRDVWVARRQGQSLDWAQLTHLHPQAEDLEIGQVETLHWKGADDWDVQGLFIQPADGTDGVPHPLVTVVHGGPTFLWSQQYFASRGWLQLLAAAGFAVLLPNPRGSTGRGLAFAESNVGDMGGKDWVDIQNGIDHCIGQRLADPDRLGIAGWSYGGFMAAWAVTQTDRFKAAVAGAPITDWRSFHGSSPLHSWDRIHLGQADPWEPGGVYQRFSPITHVRRVTTPTLLLHSEKDDVVPIEQSYLFNRALQDLGVETELAIYPGAAHDPKDRKHQRDHAQRICAWFEEHLTA